MGVAPEPAAPVARLLDEIRSLGHRGGTTAAMRSRQLALSDACVTLIEPGAVATDLPTHITHGETRQGDADHRRVVEHRRQTRPGSIPAAGSGPAPATGRPPASRTTATTYF